MIEQDKANAPLFFQRRFFPMWSSFSLGVFTDNMLKQALLIGITFSFISLPDSVSIFPGVSSGPDLVPYAGALFALAMVLFSPIAGQVADKYETSFLFRRTKFLEFLLMCTAAFGFLTGNGILLLLILFLMGVQSAFYSPARISAMPKYLNAPELIRGNAYCNGGLFVSNSLAYAVGGALIQLANGPSLIAGILVIIGLAGWLAARAAPTTKADAPELKIDFNIFAQYKKMYGYVQAEPPVIHPLLGVCIFFFIATAVTVGVPYFTRDVLHADGQVSTLLMLCFSIGALIGAGIAASLAKGTSGLQFATGAMLGATLVSIATYLLSLQFTGNAGPEPYTVVQFLSLPQAWILMAFFTASSAFSGMYLVPLQAATQRRVKPNHRARILASGNILNALAAFVGSLSVLLVTSEILKAHELFVLFAAIQGAIVFYMYRRKSSVPDGLYDEMLEAS